MGEKKKILIIEFRHETNSFCPMPTDADAYHAFRFDVGEEVFGKHGEKQQGRRNELAAFRSVFDCREDVELIPTVSMDAAPAGPVTAQVYDFVCNQIADTIKKHGPMAGVLISFHGAMVAEGHDDGEGDLLELIRSLVGWDVPVISSLDLHGNVTEKMARHATALIPYECYPHTDIYETALVAANLMADTLDGKIKPIMAYRRIPFLLPMFPSAYPEMQPLYHAAKQLNSRKGALSVRFAHGFFAADIEEMGMSVMAIADGDATLAKELADALAEVIEQNIPFLKRSYTPLDEALDAVSSSCQKPIVLADASDNPGAGGFGDTTHVLRRILERGITGAAVATITDPASVQKCVAAGVGSTVKLTLGGWSDPVYSGGPLEVDAYVKMITDGKFVSKAQMTYGEVFDHGTTVVALIEGNLLLITTFARQPYDIEIFRSHGITPEDQCILVTKSAVHYRASYSTVAQEMFSLALPGYSVPLPEGYQYKKWKGK